MNVPPDYLRLGPRAGSRVVVVGGCGAVGSGLVAACQSSGLDVAVIDLASSIAKRDARDDIRVVADATDEAEVRRAFVRLAEHWDAFDHLFFTVGYSPIPPTALKDLDIEAWDRVLAANLRSLQIVTRAGLPMIRRNGCGSVVAVSSALLYGPQKGYGAYIAAKGGLNGLVKALAIENAPEVRVNAVAPSAMLTPFMGGGAGRGGEDEARWSWFDHDAAAKAVPLGRLCTPEDVVGPMLFLASEAARFVTGQTIHVNGGRIMP